MAKLVISYETPEGTVAHTEYPEQTLPTFYGGDSGKTQCLTFVKGYLLECEIQFKSILEVYINTTIYSVYDDGLDALKEMD